MASAVYATVFADSCAMSDAGAIADKVMSRAEEVKAAAPRPAAAIAEEAVAVVAVEGSAAGASATVRVTEEELSATHAAVEEEASLEDAKDFSE